MVVSRSIMRFFRRISYYRNLGLLLAAFRISSLIFFRFLTNGSAFLPAIVSMPVSKTISGDRETVERYCQLCLRAWSAVGFKVTCLVYSLLVCRMLRESGFNAEVNFGSGKNRGRMIGHCWVTVGGETIESPYTIIFRTGEAG